MSKDTDKMLDLLAEEMPLTDENTWIPMMRGDKNNLSYWYPKIKDCGIRTPKTVICFLTDEVMKASFCENPSDRDTIRRFVDEAVMPAVKEVGNRPFIKNGCFSGKFDFSCCSPGDCSPESITESIIRINYDALCVDANGISEVVVRERIPAAKSTPTIYNGMPLRPEFRVFYDFTSRRTLYVQNYWDWDYCHGGISRNPEDKKVYEKAYARLWNHYVHNAGAILALANEKLSSVEGLEGIWSVDFLLDDARCPWLIDMAEGHRSAYWDPYKILITLCYPKIEAFYDKLHYKTGTKQSRLFEFERWQQSTSKVFETLVIEQFLEAYLTSHHLGRNAYPDAVLGGDYSPVVAFVIKHYSAGDEDIARLLEYRRRGFGRNNLSKEEKNYYKMAYSEQLKRRFAMSVVDFLSTQKLTKNK